MSTRTVIKMKARAFRPGVREIVNAVTLLLAFVGVQRNGIKLQSVIDETIAQLAGDGFLEAFDFLIDEFNDLAGAQINQMIMVIVTGFFIAGPAIPEIMTLDNAGFLEQANRPVHRRQRNPVILGRGAPVQFLGIRVIFGIRQNARNDAALIGHAEAFFNADFLDPVRHEHSPCSDILQT